MLVVQRLDLMKHNIRRLLHRCASHRTFATINSDNTSTSYSVEDCPHRTFAKRYPEAARRVLSVPSYVRNNHPILLDEKLENYLQWRGWDIEGILQDYGCGDLEQLNYSAAVGLLSHPLTFPLTLGRHISHMMYSHESKKKVDSKGYDLHGVMMKQSNNLRICCVGARAECTLPDDYWRELLCSVPYFDNQMANDDCQGENISSTEQSFDFTIDFVGPDVPKAAKSKTIQLSDNSNGKSNQQAQHHCSNKHTLTLNYHTSFLHEVILNLLKSFHDETENGSDKDIEPDSEERSLSFNQFKSELREYWDGYVLFNPGLGHTNLQKQWEPTLKYLLKTRKPILFTAHSDIDARRDCAVLGKLLYNDDTTPHIGDDRSNDGCGVEYIVNPYASKMGFVDPFATTSSVGEDEGKKVHVVCPNHSFFMLKNNLSLETGYDRNDILKKRH